LAFLGLLPLPSSFAAVAAKSPVQSAKESDPGPIKPIMDGMQGAEARLKAGDTGADTRTIQEKIVTDLQKLIDAAKPRSREGNQQQNSGSRQESGSQNRSQQQGNPATSETSTGSAGGTKADPGSSRSNQPGRKPGVGKPAGTEKEKRPSDSPRRPLMRDVWGHLPPALRERVPSDFHETILPAYDDLVRRYFEALLNGPSSAGPDPLQSPEPPKQTLPAQ
jgi:hypothetical protein